MMNKARTILESLYQSQVHPKETIVNYFYRLNEAGKINGDKKSIVDIPAVLFTLVEEMEKKIEVYDANFKEIESILGKLVDEKLSNKPSGFQKLEYKGENIVDGKTLSIGKEKENPAVHLQEFTIQDNKTKELTFVCVQEGCGRTFKSKAGLESHKRSHK